MLFEEIIKDAESAPQTIVYKLRNNLATLEDQDEALKDPYCAYMFARYVKGADIEKCQEAACKDSGWAYEFAINVPKADIEKCRKTCEGTRYAFSGLLG